MIAPIEDNGREVEIHLGGGSKGGGGVLDNGGICQNMVAQYIDTRSLLDLCEGSDRDPGAQFGMRWWKQEVIDIAGAREAAAAVAEEEGGE